MLYEITATNREGRMIFMKCKKHEIIPRIVHIEDHGGTIIFVMTEKEVRTALKRGDKYVAEASEEMADWPDADKESMMV